MASTESEMTPERKAKLRALLVDVAHNAAPKPAPFTAVQAIATMKSLAASRRNTPVSAVIGLFVTVPLPSATMEDHGHDKEPAPSESSKLRKLGIRVSLSRVSAF